MFKNKGFVWWIFIGWWLFILYISLIWWWLYLIKLIYNRFFKTCPPICFSVAGTYYNEEHIKNWLSKNSNNQWIGATFDNKPIYEYPFLDNIMDISLVPEPQNEYDSSAIAVYLGEYKAGYVPTDLTKEISRRIKKQYTTHSTIHGGNYKYKDKYGDIVKKE